MKKVKIIDEGSFYSTYYMWFEKNFKKYKKFWKYQNYSYDITKEYNLIGSDKHSEGDNNIVALIQDPDTKQVFMFNINGLEILNEEGENMKGFRKKDFKLGDLVTLRNGEKGVFDGEYIQFRCRTLEGHELDEHLKNTGMLGSGLDIMKVERYKQLTHANVTTSEMLYMNTDKAYILETLYERKEILDKQEKEYLRAVIRPFRDRIEIISKKNWFEDREYINFSLKDECGFTLATFKLGTMYKGMETGKAYSLEELGL